MRAHISQMASSEITSVARAHLEPKMAKTNNLSVIIPIFWFEENAVGSNEAIEGFRDRVYPVLRIKQYLSRSVGRSVGRLVGWPSHCIIYSAAQTIA